MSRPNPSPYPSPAHQRARGRKSRTRANRTRFSVLDRKLGQTRYRIEPVYRKSNSGHQIASLPRSICRVRRGFSVCSPNSPQPQSTPPPPPQPPPPTPFLASFVGKMRPPISSAARRARLAVGPSVRGDPSGGRVTIAAAEEEVRRRRGEARMWVRWPQCSARRGVVGDRRFSYSAAREGSSSGVRPKPASDWLRPPPIRRWR